MKLANPISIDELLGILQTEATVKGKTDNRVCGINELHSVEEGDLSFVDNEKYYDRMLRPHGKIFIIHYSLFIPPLQLDDFLLSWMYQLVSTCEQPPKT